MWRSLFCLRLRTDRMSNVPKNAEKVFSWLLFDVRQWEQEQFDWSTKTFEKVSREYTAIVFPIKDNRIAITHQRQPWVDWRYYDFVWWRVPRGADMLDQAKIELQEETWYRANQREHATTYTKSRYLDRDVSYRRATDLHKTADQELDIWWEEINVHRVEYDELLELLISWELVDRYLWYECLQLLAKWEKNKVKDIFFWI